VRWRPARLALGHGRDAGIAALADGDVERDAAEVLDAVLRAKRSPPPRPKISVASPQCGQTKALMFSTMPMTGTFMRRSIASAFSTSSSATSWGVVTRTAP
jgi:hypothetical protein